MTDKKLTVFKGAGQRPEDVTGEMSDRIKALIYEYSGRTTVASVLGTLQIVAHEIIQESK